MTTTPDDVIVQRVRAGDTDAYAVLVDRYHDRFTRLARQLVGNPQDAEEVLQDTFVRAYRALDRYDPRERFGAWLLRILVNRARTVAARDRNRARLLAEGVADVGEPAIAHPEERDALRDEVARALSRLPAEQREAFLLHHVEGLSYEEMMSATGLGLSALKMRVKRSCDRLRELLQEVYRG